MKTSYLIYGFSLIILGLLIKAFPVLIAGYNSMTNEQKINVDIKGLSTNMRNTFIVMGLAIIVSYFLLDYWLGLDKIAEIVAFVIFWGGLISLFINGRRYDLRKKQKNN